MRSVLIAALIGSAAGAENNLLTCKRALTRISAVTNRGQTASPAELAQARAYVKQLEAAGAARAGVALAGAPPPAAMDGSWELVFADVPLYRSNPFFMAFGDALADGDRNFAGATSARIHWTVDGSTLSSDVDLKVGFPGMPVQAIGKLRTEAALGGSGTNAQELLASIKATSVVGTALNLAMPDFTKGGEIEHMTVYDERVRSLIEQVRVPSGALFGERTVKLAVLYVDYEILLVRASDLKDHVGFVFLRESATA